LPAPAPNTRAPSGPATPAAASLVLQIANCNTLPLKQGMNRILIAVKPIGIFGIVYFFE
jgi:hypothetical protein